VTGVQTCALPDLVPAEMHVYVNGGHGFGIRKSGKTSAAWPAAFGAWLATLPGA
jgi:hypothetical protein